MVPRITGGHGLPKRSIARIPIKKAAKTYYISETGSWLRKAEALHFQSPFSPIDWIRGNMPRSEKQPMNFLLSALSSGNSSVHANHRVFGIYASAYIYINSNARARKELNDVYLKLINEGLPHTEIKVHMVKDRLSLTCFAFQRNENKLISSDYLKTIIKVYLHYAENLVNTNEVEPTEPEGNGEPPLQIT